MKHDELIAEILAKPITATARERAAAEEIERLRAANRDLQEWGNAAIEELEARTAALRNGVTVEIKVAGTDEEGNCRIIAFTTPLELEKSPPLIYRRAKLVLQPNT